MLRIFISTALVLSCFKINAQVQIFEDSEPRFIQAMKLERMGNVERAKELYQKILNKDPSHQPSYFQLKNIYNKMVNLTLELSLLKAGLIRIQVIINQNYRWVSFILGISNRKML